jgi:peptidyl-tRNA hydrolase, PTH1 family
MKLIVGLGNPGTKYDKTRHNVGFSVITHLSEKFNLPLIEETKFKAEFVKGTFFYLLKPLMFMNNSGIPVSRVTTFYKILPSDVWVVHDDIDLPLGKIRIRKGGASAGHHGIDSIIEHLGSDQFVRFRLGVGRGKEDIKESEGKTSHLHKAENIVLERFPEREMGEHRKMIKRASEAVEIALEKGIVVAMNRFN